jgi:GNAT superfamily N-acetyltransferase
MHLISYSTQSAGQLAALFDEDLPVAIRLWSILDGLSAGRILVDDPDTPAFALVQEPADGTTYIGGAASPPNLAAGIALLQRQQPVVVGLWPGDPLHSQLPPSPVYQGVAVDFTDRSPTVDLNALAAAPAGYELRPIDASLLPGLAGFDYYIAMYGTAERALEQTIGFCVLDGADVVGEAVAGPLARGIAEIGVGTKESHRRQGLATAAAAAVIQACEALGYRAFWNAAERNTASVALARRLGFCTARSFAVYAW